LLVIPCTWSSSFQSSVSAAIKTDFDVEEAGIPPITCWTEKLGHCIQNANRVFQGSGTPAGTSCAWHNADRN